MNSQDPRRPARGQKLPAQAAWMLNVYVRGSNHFLWTLVAHYNQGWTYRALGEGLTPPVSRYTVRNWVHSAPPAPPGWEVAHTYPIYATDREYERKTDPPKPINPSDQATLAKIAPIAARYRRGMSDATAPAIANATMDMIVVRLTGYGCSVSDIAKCSGVSPRAIYNRLEKIKKAEPK